MASKFKFIWENPNGERFTVRYQVKQGELIILEMINSEFNEIIDYPEELTTAVADHYAQN